MQAGRKKSSFRMAVERILEEAFPEETGAARLQQVGLFTVIYLLQDDAEGVTAKRLSLVTDQDDGKISRQLKKLIALDLVERTPVLQDQGRGRAYKLTVKDTPQAKRLIKAIEKTGRRKRKT